MILETAILYIKPGQQHLFEKDFALAGKYISSVKGYLGHKLLKCIEQDNKYMLFVDWEKLEDHTIGFRQSEAYTYWRNLLHHYYHPFPAVEHHETCITKIARIDS
ncbi:antibiotic biosynthesis monooxygenase family protein [Rubrolithibacter danxiaensis]|uniref:antibiotic biosynthesis monooxygenase family protein n=1 Tax=Rubrolithibacter danxiaensis TaxID=3390805 RepID=UPI003BF82CBC